MPRAKAVTATPVEPVEEEEVHEDPTPPLQEVVEFVPREEYDNAIKDLRNTISDLREQVSDLELVVTQPTGAVNFLDVVGRQTGEVEVTEDDDVPMYSPQERLEPGVSDGVTWYQGD